VITVISTSFGSTSSRCVESVARQTQVEVEHVRIEETDPGRSKIENVLAAVRSLPPKSIVALVDGDDELACPDALARAAQWHHAGAWVTWGSFRYADGSPGFASPYRYDETPRRAPWRATHLKTLRAGIVQRIPEAYLRGAAHRWTRADDMGIMFAAIELAGIDRSVYIDDVLYVYSLETAYELTGGDMARLKADEDYLRSLAPLDRLETR